MMEFDQVWYLGDAIKGTDLETNRRVTETQVELLERLNAPLRYVMGNHDLDYARETGDVSSPFYEAVRSKERRRTTTNPDEFYFLDELDGWTVFFLSDHVDLEARWSVMHGKIHGDTDRYLYTNDDYREAIDRLARSDRPIVTAGHNAFPNGNRPAELQRQFFPLPDTVQIHLYGHAHIGGSGLGRTPTGRYRTSTTIESRRSTSRPWKNGEVTRSAPRSCIFAPTAAAASTCGTTVEKRGWSRAMFTRIRPGHPPSFRCLFSADPASCDATAAKQGVGLIKMLIASQSGLEFASGGGTDTFPPLPITALQQRTPNARSSKSVR
jgi:calcineurin-like phosphoesterase family protein